MKHHDYLEGFISTMITRKKKIKYNSCSESECPDRPNVRYSFFKTEYRCPIMCGDTMNIHRRLGMEESLWY